MAENTKVEQLTPLDLLMPPTYITALLTFRTAESTCSVSERLQRALDGLVKQVPWLSGRIVAKTTMGGEAPTMEIQWDPDMQTPKLINKGSIAASYETLAASHMPSTAIPTDMWPAPSANDDRGTPVFAASLFGFSDNQGVGLSVCVHHKAVDASGFAQVIRHWARLIGGTQQPHSGLSQGRVSCLAQALSSELASVSSTPDGLLASHPEFTTTPPTFPTEFPPCTSRLFSISVARVNAIKDLLHASMNAAPSTNTLICALVWSAITRARIQRNPSLAKETSRLATAVNGRRRIHGQFSTLDNPYLGNLILYALADLPVQSLTPGSDRDKTELARICNAVSESQSATRINRRHIAEVYSLVDLVGDYRKVFVGWDLFHSRDLTITSWADLDFYEMDFGPQLGNPDFIRLPYMEADGVGMVLPRRRAAGTDEVVEVMIMLRNEDMEFLQRDEEWAADGFISRSE